MEKQFTVRQVFILVLLIVMAIAFFETDYNLWTQQFWREFGLKVIAYGFISEIVVISLVPKED